MQILLKNGTVIDGTGARGRQGDVRVVGDTITQIGPRLVPQKGENVLDARGRVVAPGFIDTHSHADGGLLENPTAETQIRQGITTSVVGQDGGSHLPLRDWWEQVEKTKVALNLASFVGHGTVRGKVLGADYKRRATPAEVAQMAALVEAEMQTGGALGLSSGLEYDPGLYSDVSEVITLARVAAKYKGIYISHVRDEENEALDSFRELIRIASEAGLPAQISHIKLGSAPVWGKTGEVFGLMRAAKARGVDISADVYPYTYWQSSITVIIPTREWSNRALWDTGLAEIGGAKNVLLSTYEPNRAWEGRTVADLAQAQKTDAVTLIQRIIAATHDATPKRAESVVVTAMQEADVRAFVAQPGVMFCSDGGLRGSHPRGAGTFPRVLGKYVRDDKALSLEAAVHKMTGLSAARMGFANRGVIKVGNKADLVVFDPRTIRDTATTKNPRSAPMGLDDVLVNGTLVLRAGKITSERPGQIIKRAA